MTTHKFVIYIVYYQTILLIWFFKYLFIYLYKKVKKNSNIMCHSGTYLKKYINKFKKKKSHIEEWEAQSFNVSNII